MTRRTAPQRWLRLVALLATASLALSACAGAPDNAETSAPDGGLTGSLRVFAAASLTAPFTELTGLFAAENPGVTVEPTTFDGSPTLATQIAEGAPADVFASADDTTMGSVSKWWHDAPHTFATNTMEIAVQRGNPKHITGLGDLTAPGLQVVLCAPKVPCGVAAHRLLDLDAVSLTPVSEEQSVTAVLTKVRLGEADAGLVYTTDVLAAGNDVGGVPISGSARVISEYPIATLTTGTNPSAATAFVEFVLSARGQSVLAKFGFGAPQ